MCRIQAYFAIGGIAFLLSSPLQTQTAQTNATTFTSSTELVLIPTVVNDKSGAHISGLTKEEFALKQDGKSRPIAVFEEVKTNSARVRRSEGEHGTFSNFDPGGSDYHRLNIIVFDFVNTPFPDQANARIALLKFLSDVAESGEPMCLLALTSRGLTLLHDFTDDPKRLAEGLRKMGSNTQPLIHESTVDPGHPPAERSVRRNAYEDDQGTIANRGPVGLHGEKRDCVRDSPSVAANRESLPRFTRTEIAYLGELWFPVLVESTFHPHVRTGLSRPPTR
jgi:hypothetical protein